jgi:hypothetical protein
MAGIAAAKAKGVKFGRHIRQANLSVRIHPKVAAFHELVQETSVRFGTQLR